MPIFIMIRFLYIFLSFMKRILSTKFPVNKFVGMKFKRAIENQYIQTINNKHTFSENDVDQFLRENEFIKNKKIISISPGFKSNWARS